jgi:hypothetical protein
LVLRAALNELIFEFEHNFSGKLFQSLLLLTTNEFSAESTPTRGTSLVIEKYCVLHGNGFCGSKMEVAKTQKGNETDIALNNGYVKTIVNKSYKFKMFCRRHISRDNKTFVRAIDFVLKANVFQFSLCWQS